MGRRGRWARLSRSRISRGQSMVEFAFLSAFALVLMLVGIQYALIGQMALAVSQGSSALARYAAVYPGTFGTNNGTATLPTQAAALLSPTINDAHLTVTINSYTNTGASETGTIIPSQDQVVINLSYDATTKLVLPNPFMQIPPFFPGINFPTQLTSQQSQLYE